MNKQSNLNGFFDVTAGSGSYAPRKRQAYASKRLQQVVNDFRSKRNRGSTSPASSSSHSESDGETEPPKKRKSVAKGKARAATSRRGRGGRGARGSSTSSRPKKAASSRGDEFKGTKEPQQDIVDIPPDPVIVARLRPRPKPAYPGAQRSSGDVDTLSDS